MWCEDPWSARRMFLRVILLSQSSICLRIFWSSISKHVSCLSFSLLVSVTLLWLTAWQEPRWVISVVVTVKMLGPQKSETSWLEGRKASRKHPCCMKVSLLPLIWFWKPSISMTFDIRSFKGVILQLVFGKLRTFFWKRHVWWLQRRTGSKPTCLLLRVAGELYDQGLVVFLGIRELGLYFPLVIISKHLWALAVSDEVLVA